MIWQNLHALTQNYFSTALITTLHLERPRGTNCKINSSISGQCHIIWITIKAALSNLNNESIMLWRRTGATSCITGDNWSHLSNKKQQRSPKRENCFLSVKERRLECRKCPSTAPERSGWSAPPRAAYQGSYSTATTSTSAPHSDTVSDPDS